MISFLSSWAKNLSLAIIIVSILEMLLPDSKTKKYIKVIMGLYILFSIVSPFINNNESISLTNLNIEEYVSSEVQSTNETVDQTSMNTRIKQIYVEELEKDIINKIEEKGYIVEDCNVKITVNENNEVNIEKITLNVSKEQENKKDETIEDKLVTQIQKIQKVTIDLDEENETADNSNSTNLSNQDKKMLAEFLTNEYEVSEKCLKIN